MQQARLLCAPQHHQKAWHCNLVALKTGLACLSQGVSPAGIPKMTRWHRSEALTWFFMVVSTVVGGSSDAGPGKKRSQSTALGMVSEARPNSCSSHVTL